MEREEKLFKIAERQQGYFTTSQAQSLGYFRSNISEKVRIGKWKKEHRGIYRLSQYPQTDRPELVLWYLWSCDKKGEPQGVWSHETALDIYDICDIMPSKMHMTVPKGFRKSKIPSFLILHHMNLSELDYTNQNGFKLTTPIRTLVDIIRDAKIEESLIFQAFTEAKNKGLLPPSILKKAISKYPEIRKLNCESQRIK